MFEVLYGKRCTVSLRDLRTNVRNLLNMSPSSLAQVTSPKEDNTGNKVSRHTPEDSILKTLKRRRNSTKEASYWYDEKLSKEDKAERLAFYESIEIDKKKKTEDTDSDYEEESSDESETCSEDDLYGKKNYARKKRPVRKWEENTDESETCSEDDDPSYGKKKKKEAQKRVKEKYIKKKKTAQKKTTVLSAYEKMAEEKKAERLAFLKSLNIDEFKADLSKPVNKKVKSEPARRILKKKEDCSEPLPIRQSKRLVHMEILKRENCTESLLTRQSKRLANMEIVKREESIPQSMRLANADSSSDFSDLENEYF